MIFFLGQRFLCPLNQLLHFLRSKIRRSGVKKYSNGFTRGIYHPHLIVSLFVFASVLFIFLCILQKLLVKMLNGTFVKTKILPRIKDIFQKLIISPNLLLVAVSEFLNINTTHQFFDIFVGKFSTLNTRR